MRENLAPLHRYVGLRQQFLGLDNVHMYDLYAPIIRDVNWKVPYEEAVQLVLEGLAPMGDEYVQKLRKSFEDHSTCSNWQGSTCGHPSPSDRHWPSL